jgi:hypothetical protein
MENLTTKIKVSEDTPYKLLRTAILMGCCAPVLGDANGMPASVVNETLSSYSLLPYAKVIDRMLAEAKQLRAVCQVCPAASRPAHNIDNVLGML